MEPADWSSLTFEEFLTAELPQLAQFSRVMTGNRQEAHDVLADALIKAHRNWSKIQTMARPTSYVRRIVVTTYLNGRRTWSYRNIRSLDPVALTTGDARTDETTAVDNREQLASHLRRLPKQQRAAIVMRFYLGLDDAEIAENLRCQQGAVRTYISRALRSLRITMDEQSKADNPPPTLAAHKERIREAE